MPLYGSIQPKKLWMTSRALGPTLKGKKHMSAVWYEKYKGGQKLSAALA